MREMDLLLKVFFFIFGAMIGSFLNALIYRIPREISFIFPRSACPHCKIVIPWFYNIPLLSFIVLKGKCFSCQGAISWRYPLVELITALFALFVFSPLLISPLWPKAILFFLFFCHFITIFFIDIDFHIIPNGLNFSLGVVIFLFVFLYGNLLQGLWGTLLGVSFPLLITLLFYYLKGQVGLGGGDIKLYGVLGFILGPLGIVNTLFFSCLMGSLFAGVLLVLKKIDRQTPIAFGPFIVISAFFQIFFPDLYQRVFFFLQV